MPCRECCPFHAMHDTMGVKVKVCGCASCHGVVAIYNICIIFPRVCAVSCSGCVCKVRAYIICVYVCRVAVPFLLPESGKLAGLYGPASGLLLVCFAASARAAAFLLVVVVRPCPFGFFSSPPLACSACGVLRPSMFLLGLL